MNITNGRATLPLGSAHALDTMLAEVRACRLCASHLPLGPRPVLVAFFPKGFCCPGRGASGDLPPRPECAPAWRAKLLTQLPNIRLTLLVGQYAQAWHLGARRKATLTETVRGWRDYGPATLPLPHPSPRNNIWLQRNPWFEREVVPTLRAWVQALR